MDFKKSRVVFDRDSLHGYVVPLMFAVQDAASKDFFDVLSETSKTPFKITFFLCSSREDKDPVAIFERLEKKKS